MPPDFLSYAILDLVDREMVKLHAKATKKEYPVAYSILEALTAFMQSDLQWARTFSYLHLHSV